MGILTHFFDRPARVGERTSDHKSRINVIAQRRLSGWELMEPRCLLSGTPLEIGAVYVAQDVGSDPSGGPLEITFSGGAPGTQLSRVVIDGDQDTPGFGVGDVSFGHLTEDNVYELPPGRIAGYVFQDGAAIEVQGPHDMPVGIGDLRDGVRTPDDTPLQGVVMALRDGISGRPITAAEALPGVYEAGPISTVTDSRGYYEFVGLPPGSYAVFERQPDGFVDGVDSPGTLSGIAFNPGEPIGTTVAVSLQVDPMNDAIVRIGLPPGAESSENNFSEVRVAIKPPPPQVPPVVPRLSPLPATRVPPVVIDIFFEPLLPELGNFRPPAVQLGPGGPPPHHWHLSILDAGQPRGDGVVVTDQEVIWFAAAGGGSARPQSARMQQGAWHLPDDGPRRRAPQAALWFGTTSAVAVTGDFNGDGSSEIGVFLEGDWLIDLNANGTWDDGDLWARLGKKNDRPVVGDFNGDGKDDIGVVGRAWAGDEQAIAAEPGLPDFQNHARPKPKNIPPEPHEATVGDRLLQRTSRGRIRADVIDHVFHFGLRGDIPVCGDWNGDGIDSAGIFRRGKWHLDVNGDGRWSAGDRVEQFGQAGDVPVAGDFNGDGFDDPGVFREGTFYLDSNGNRVLDDQDRVVQQGQPGDQPVVGDFDGDGTDDVGIYRSAGPPVREARSE